MGVIYYLLIHIVIFHCVKSGFVPWTDINTDASWFDYQGKRAMLMVPVMLTGRVLLYFAVIQ